MPANGKDYCDDPAEHGCDRRDAKYRMDDRLRVAYMVAVRNQHGSSVQIHVGQQVLDYLRSLAVKEAERTIGGPTMWGFPLVLTESHAADHISVHSVEVIL